MSAAARVDIYRKCKNSKKELGNELRVPSTLSASVAATVDLYPMQQDDGEWYCHKGGLSFFSRILNTWVTQKSKLIHKLPALGIVEGLIITNDGIEDGQGDTHGGSVEHYTSRPNAEEDNPMKLSDFKLCLNDLGELLERVNINGDPYHNTQSGKKKDKDKDDAGTKGSGKRKGAKSKSSNKEKGEGVHESNGTDKNNVGGTSSPGISNSAAMGRRMVDGEPTQGEMSVEDNGSEMLTENTHGSGHSDNSSDHDDEGDSDESTDSEDEDEKHFKTYPYRRPVVPSTIVGPFAGEPIRYFLASTLWYAAHYGKESLDFNDADVVSLNRIAAHLDSGEVSIQHLLRHRAPRTMNPENDMLLWLLPGTDDAILAVKAIHYMLQHPAFTEDPSLDGSLWLLKVMARDLELPSEGKSPYKRMQPF
ncbi:hypothetical protein BKA69DRAFT_1094443 [Paraphysoderma sedebokerense]|nr:hypothetical protein BKA69DRAFT_1094443 [Paraphysoderma sedebokerense]